MTCFHLVYYLVRSTGIYSQVSGKIYEYLSRPKWKYACGFHAHRSRGTRSQPCCVFVDNSYRLRKPGVWFLLLECLRSRWYPVVLASELRVSCLSLSGTRGQPWCVFVDDIYRFYKPALWFLLLECLRSRWYLAVLASELRVHATYFFGRNQDIFRLLDQREQEKMEWEWLEGGIEGRAKAAPLSLSHGLVRSKKNKVHTLLV